MTTMPPPSTTTLPPRVWGYLRVSSAAQQTGSDSLEAQADKIRAYASKRGYALEGLEADVASASAHPLTWRPGALAALKAARDAGGVLVVARADRLTRKVNDIPRIFAFGVPIHVVDTGRVSRKRLKQLVLKGQQEAGAKSASQLNAHACRNSVGRCASPATPAGRQAGRERSQQRRDANVYRVFEFARQTDAFASATMKRRVEILNAAGVAYVRHAANPDGEAWTRRALRGLWPRIHPLLNAETDNTPGPAG